MDVTDLHQRTVAEFVSRLDTVGDKWSAPTPCSDWDVRALVNHIAYEDLWTVPLMEGATIAEVGDRFEGDLLGDDPVAAARAAADAATIAAASGLVAGRTVHLSFGDTPAEEYAYQLAADHLIHGWDLAAATGGDRRFDPE
ncbi:MAG TPA: TIGR03086 family metal-binding protein, partial [Acidimicrobiales bacterium]|nr:TIGR03086 family metal-binding protein [Acidimicrobiales bacterium]